MRILDKDYEVRYNLRSMLVFEQITDKPFEVKTLLDTYILFYSCLVSVKTNPSLDFDNFIDWCSNHPETIEEFKDLISDENKKRELVDKKKVMEENN